MERVLILRFGERESVDVFFEKKSDIFQNFGSVHFGKFENVIFVVLQFFDENKEGDIFGADEFDGVDFEKKISL